VTAYLNKLSQSFLM